MMLGSYCDECRIFSTSNFRATTAAPVSVSRVLCQTTSSAGPRLIARDASLAEDGSGRQIKGA